MSYGNWKQPKVVFSFHNSKIRELSDGNRVMETELSFAKQLFCYGSHHFWVMSYENRELSYQKMQSKRPLNFRHSSFITHHSKYYTCLAPQFSSLNIFHTICRSHTCHSLQTLFFLIPKLTEPSEKKKTKKPGTERSERKKKKNKKKEKIREHI